MRVCVCVEAGQIAAPQVTAAQILAAISCSCERRVCAPPHSGGVHAAGAKGARGARFLTVASKKMAGNNRSWARIRRAPQKMAGIQIVARICL